MMINRRTALQYCDDLKKYIGNMREFNKVIHDYHHDCNIAAQFEDNNPEALEVLRAVTHICDEWDRLVDGDL